MSMNLLAAKFALNCPNFFTGGMHGLLYGLSVVVAVIPRVGSSAAKVLRDEGRQYTFDSNKRDEDHIRHITQLVESENKVKKVSAKENLRQGLDDLKTAEQTKDQKTGLAEKQADLSVLNRQVDADKTIIGSKGKGKKKVIEADEAQRIKRVDQNTGYELKEQETKHQTQMFKRTTKHLGVMKDFTGDLSLAAKEGADATEAYATSVAGADKEVQKFTEGMGKVNEAYSKLNQALADYTSETHAGELGDAKAVKIEQALLDVMQADSDLDTKLDLDKIAISSDLKQSFKIDLADKNKAISALLGEHSSQSLEKLAELITTDMTAQQEKIKELTSPADIDACQIHISQLKTLLDNVDKIEAGKKIDPDPEPDDLDDTSTLKV